jgi:HlyD family secretion protein
MARFISIPPRHAASRLAFTFLSAALAFTGSPQLFAASPSEHQAPKGAVVSVVTAKKACFDDVMEITGALVAKEEVLVRPDREGLQISQVLVEAGDQVEAGQALALLVSADSQPGGGTPLSIQAPAAGVISFASATIGAIASARAEPLFRIIARGELELSAELPVKYLSRLSNGLPAKIKVAGIGGLAGRVVFISKTIDPSTQLGEVRLSIGTDERLKAGALGWALINSGQRCDGLAVPLSALLYSEEGTVVEVVRDGRVESEFVTTGLQSGESIEILQGLAEGDVIVARAAAFLRDGDRVTPAPGSEP